MLISLREPPEGTGGCAGSWLWAKVLGDEPAPLERDRDGWVLEAPELQTRREIGRIARLVNEVFSDPQRLRDAAFFVDGYTCAYNDRMSGEGDG